MKILFSSLFLIFVSVSGVQAQESVDRKAQLCTELENFFRTNPTPTPDLLSQYFETSGRDQSLLNLYPRTLNPLTVFQTLKRGHGRGTFQESCSSIIPAPSLSMARGEGQARMALSLNPAPTHTHPLRIGEIAPSTNSLEAVDYCKEKEHCVPINTSAPETQEVCRIAQALFPPQNPGETTGQCACLREIQVMRCTPYDPQTTSEQMRSSVLQRFGQNFLNDFAQLREDTNFYAKRFENFSPPRTPDFSCSEFPSFKNKVKSQCGNRPVNEERMQTILNAFHNLPSGNAESMFKATDRQITNPLAQNGVTRDFSDYNRQLLTMNPELQVMDRMIQDCLAGGGNIRAGEWLRENVPRGANAPEPMPFQQIAQLLKKKAFADPAAFIRRYLNRESLGERNYGEFVDYLENRQNLDNPDFASNIFGERLLALMQGHPGFDSLLSDKDYAKKVSALLPTENGNLRSLLESKESEILDEFGKRCEKIQNTFASLVCDSDQQIMGRVSPLDLKKIMIDFDLDHNSDDAFNPQNIDRLRCQITGNLDGSTSGIYDELAKTPSFSDYYKRMLPNQPDVMSVIGDNLQRNRQAYLQSLLSGHQNQSGSVVRPYSPVNDPTAIAVFLEIPTMAASPNRAAQIDSSAPEAASAVKIEPAVAQPSSDSNAADNVTNDTTNNNVTETSRGNNSANVPAPFTLPPLPQPSDSEAKRLLRASLGGEAQAETIENLVSNLDDTEVSELSRLREELAQRKEREIVDLTTRSEQLTQSIRRLEQNQSRLENEQANPISRTELAAVDRRPASTTAIDAPSPVRGLSPPRSGARQEQTSGDPADAIAAAFAPSSGAAGSASILPARAGSPAAASRNGAVVVSRYGPASSGGPVALDISAAAARNGEVPPEEVNGNILRYLKQNSLDLRTLIQIRESGMLFRYRVNERGQVAEREMLVAYDNLAPEIRQFIDQKILSARATPAELQRISNEIRLQKRTYSYDTLRAIIIGTANR